MRSDDCSGEGPCVPHSSLKSPTPSARPKTRCRALVEALLADCTLGEMTQAMADIYGRYTGGPEW